jgi:glucoamylase
MGIIQEVPSIRPLDSAVHLGILYSHMGDGYLDPSSQEAQSSIGVLVDSFANYSATFTINAKDDAAGLPGLLVGRYLNDNYNGGNSSQPGGGNPWILTTASLGEFFYTGAAQALGVALQQAVGGVNRRG